MWYIWDTFETHGTALFAHWITFTNGPCQRTSLCESDHEVVNRKQSFRSEISQRISRFKVIPSPPWSDPVVISFKGVLSHKESVRPLPQVQKWKQSKVTECQRSTLEWRTMKNSWKLAPVLAPCDLCSAFKPALFCKFAAWPSAWSLQGSRATRSCDFYVVSTSTLHTCRIHSVEEKRHWQRGQWADCDDWHILTLWVSIATRILDMLD